MIKIKTVLCLYGFLTTVYNLVVPFFYLVLCKFPSNKVFCLDGCFSKEIKKTDIKYKFVDPIYYY